MSGLFSGRKKLKVDCGELEDGKDQLSNFLRKNLNEEVASDGYNLLTDLGKMSPQELKVLVNRFIYHQHLNSRWIALERRSKRTVNDCYSPNIPNLKKGRKFSLANFYGIACVI